MLNLTSTGVCNTGVSALCVTCFLINMVVDVVIQNPQKYNEYEYEKKNMHVVTPTCAAAAVFSAVVPDDRRKNTRTRTP